MNMFKEGCVLLIVAFQGLGARCPGTDEGYHLESSQKAHKTKGTQASGSKTARGKMDFLEIFPKTKSDWFCG